MPTRAPIIIIGSGPTGIGAALRLNELKANWLMLEREQYVGGLAASFFVNSYVWDIGGHVIFSHYDAYDELLARCVPGDQWLYHPRNAQIRTGDTWVPYPFQLNLDALPLAQRNDCIEGMNSVQGTVVDRSNFASYIDSHFGEGIATQFMRPYNEKIWAHPLNKMSVSWLGERVATLESKAKGKNWGPNNQFRFPAFGGTGSIWKNACNDLPTSRVKLNCEVTGIDSSRQQLTVNSDNMLEYSAMISTMPIDRLANICTFPDAVEVASELSHSSVHIVGLGILGEIPEPIEKFCWMYFPEDSCPFYRATIFSRYSPNNAPEGNWSLLLEISESSYKSVDTNNLVNDCIRSCVKNSLIRNTSDIVNQWHFRAEYGYPIPTLNRDNTMSCLHDIFEKKNIFSRGRFGAWKYEVGNMDHSFMQGREIADRLVTGAKEVTINFPDQVNNQSTGTREKSSV